MSTETSTDTVGSITVTRNISCEDGKKPLDGRWIWVGLTLIILIFLPWLFFLSLLGLVLGFCSLEFVNKTVQPLILGHLKRKISEDRYDPLLHPTDEISQGMCRVCDVINCSRDSHHDRPRLRSSWSVTQQSQDLRIDPRLDTAIAEFFTAVFDVYVSPAWAPYESRLELKRILVKTLLSFGQGVKATLFSNEDDAKIFVRQKVLPLLLFHIKTIQDGVHLSPEEEESASDRVLNLTKILLKKYLSPDDAKCKLWTELVLSVLGSGVFWNLILLGRHEIPVLVTEILEGKTPALHSGIGNEGSMRVTISEDSDPSNLDENVSFLFDSFLDPARDVEQPSPIMSRHRPSMAYVLKESELLYCLIQFLKGEGALEWLQAVLDQDPNNPVPSTYFPRKVIEVKHLNHFTRSRVFLENLGFNRVEPAVEVNPDLQLLNSTKSSSHHTRSSSYGGGVSTGIWEQKVVEGVAIYPLLNQAIPAPSPSNISPPSVDSDSLFRRRHTLEPFITKFYASLHQPKAANGNEEEIDKEAIPPLKRRVGLEPKARKSTSLKRVVISNKPKDVLDNLTSTVISLMRKDSPWKGVFAGWIEFLRPLLNDKLNEVIDTWTEKALALDNILLFINLITDAFAMSQDLDIRRRNSSVPAQVNIVPEDAGETGTTGYSRSVTWILESLFDIEDLVQKLSSNPDGILLFFVDLLDLLVSALTSPHSTSTQVS